jgi:tetratricopeptide (TPR) repeat protein
MPENSADLSLVANRYILHEKIGAGGMGAVYRATDRLGDVTVALKQVTLTPGQLEFASRNSMGDTKNFRLALAQEFRTLASLRHPNIISVLDYGFDDDRQPYFTMELLENAQSLVVYGRTKSVEVQVDLLIQILQALSYLHRRGIIHRDLKPDNALVVNGQLKVLDFGLAIARETQGETDGVAGTLGYIAPEVLQGAPSSEASDLYAMGVMAYELFAGRHPFNAHQVSVSVLIQEILNTTPDVLSLPVDERLKETLEKLLSKVPEDRPTSGIGLIPAYAEVTSKQMQYETTGIRESFLQAAQFVGRETELEQLSDALRQTIAGSGSAWLVGGESGVGKSRLLDELRTVALVNGALVLRGQAIAEGGAPYLLLRDALRRLCLHTSLTELESSVLKSLVPDIGALIGREVADAPEINPQAAQTRLLTVIEAIFRKQTQPIVLLLEDLQWASESLSVLQWLNRTVVELPLLIVANYRDDEHPDLPSELPDMQTMKIARLNVKSIADLSVAMLGENGRQPQIVDLLQRETEGNVFFIVEVVRVLAEEAGQLGHVGLTTLPRKIVAGGMQAVVQRRLNHVPEHARPLLEIAGVAGRELDLNIVRAAASNVIVDSWLSACADASVLDVQEGRWRFAHDKLREGLLMNLSNEHRRELHKQVAIAIEACYPDDYAQAAALVGHWGAVGNETKEAHYAALAGQQALASSAYRTAIPFLIRALTLATRVNTPKSEQAYLEQKLGNAYLGDGQPFETPPHSQKAIALLGYPEPTFPFLIVQVLKQVLKQLWHRVYMDGLGRTLSLRGDPREISALIQASEDLAKYHFLSNEKLYALYHTLVALNLAERGGPVNITGLLRQYASNIVSWGIVPVHRIAEHYARHADQISSYVEDTSAIIWMHEMNGLYSGGRADWETAASHLRQAILLAEQIGEWSQLEDATAILAEVYYLQGQWDLASAFTHKHLEVVRSQNAVQGIGGALGRQSHLALYLGQFELALSQAQEGLSILEQIGDQSQLIRVLGVLTQVYIRIGNIEAAQQITDRILSIITQSSPTSFYMLETYAGLAEYYLLQSEIQSYRPQIETQKALKYLHQFARIFDVGKPRAATFQGWYHWLEGNPDNAEKAGLKGIAEAQRLKMPYEEGLAHYHLGRFLSAADPHRNEYLHQAVAIFERLGAKGDLEGARTALDKVSP